MRFRIPPKTLLLSFGLSLVFPLLIFLLFSPMLDQLVAEESSQEAFKAANFLKEHLDIRASELDTAGHNADTQKTLKDVTQNLGLYETCIISADGRIVYSSEDKHCGARVSGKLMNDLLSKGEQYAAVKHTGETSLEGFPVKGTVVEAYVPIFDIGKVIGGVAVFNDFSELSGGIGKLKFSLAGMLFLISFSAMMLVYASHTRAEQGERLRTRAEEALEQEQIRAETVFSSLGDNIIIQDRDYKIIYQNSINRDTWGEHLGECCYKVYEGLDHICPDCPVELTYRDGAIHKSEKEVVTPNGTLNLELTASPLRNAQGEIVAGIKLVRDITEMRHIERQLRHAQKMQAIGTLTSGISHEFNNLLCSINGFSEILLETTEKDTEQFRYIDAIHRSGKRAEAVTRGLLAYSRKQITNRTEVSLNSTVRDMGRVFSPIIGPDITMRVDAPLEELTVMADQNQLEQVLINIITNARDAMPGGGQLLILAKGVTADEEFTNHYGFGTPGTRYGAIHIMDTGSGMDRQTMDQIFEPFFTTKDVGRGTGLGLAIAYGIVEQHGGLMDVTSSPGEGTEFSIFLPLVAADKGGADKGIAEGGRGPA